jgi:haloalkane dehalogenase
MKSILMDGHRIAYRDEGHQTEAGSPLVLVHGTPSSSQEFATVIESLKPNYRCIAIDHLGFGQSDKPVNGDYSLNAHTERLTFLLFDHLKLESFHLFVAVEFWRGVCRPARV